MPAVARGTHGEADVAVAPMVRRGRSAEAMTPFTPFRRRWPWVTADLQTIRNDLPGRLPGVPADSGRRIEIPLSDGSGDRLAARFHPGRAKAPAVILVPGLTGCEASRHVLQATDAWAADGAPVVRLNLRGAPPGRSLAKGHYHMDRVQDLADACLAVGDLDPGIRCHGVVVVGFSLGGALALRLAQAPDCPDLVKAVVTVSAPLDLPATAERIARPRNRFYERWLLRRLKQETAPLWRDGPAAVRAAVQAARHIHEFDDALTAKEAGFRDAADYYASCSPMNDMGGLGIPALVIHADDDPWVPPPSVVERPPLRVVVTRGGGHVGFHGRGSRMPWYVGAAARFLKSLPR